jgi:hypothetical protein
MILNTLIYVCINALQIPWCMADPSTWDPLSLQLKCRRLMFAAPLSGAFNIICDTFILLMPQRVIWKLHLPRAKKISVSLLFIGGFL